VLFGQPLLVFVRMQGGSLKITVQVKPNARKDEVVVRQDGIYVVKVSVPPIEGRANERLIEILAAYFKKPKRSIQILVGAHGKNKIVEIQ
jgi:uncharacterized protein (TIGR00251 family)